ncbi:MAG: LL-diaminopimelate aminotransferase [Firmicutes bacterium]|nr:LL-diaminopimelate aminotransferase [Alicyclobacillaceae bacterium]MCL6498283.1 LL-diaminopimelate aminotransferase [Bacillota bacterium]
MAGLPPYLFLELDRIVERERARGKDIINLGIGDPDQPTPAHIVEAMKRALDRAQNHRYPDYLGSRAFRAAMADWYRRRFGVTVDPNEEVVGLIGSKEGIAHLIWAWAGPGDIVLVPDPAYPVYQTVTLLADATVYPLPLRPDRQFLPDLEAIPEAVLAKAKMLWLNYPNNPTGAIASREFLTQAVELCRRWDILLCHDAAYAEMGFDGYRAPSVLEIPKAREVAIEFYSFSKPFNMTGWRIAAAVGAAPAIAALGQLKSNLDSGPFTAVQEAAMAALAEDPEAVFQTMNALYQTRRDVVVAKLRAMGFPVEPPRATFYVWFPTPRGMTSAEASAFFVEQAQVVVTPGRAYGEHGEGWLRIALTVEKPRLEEALDRMARALG